jgi:excisionase family DNA binding protein
VNLKTAARRLGVHYQTAYRWVRSGQLLAVKVGSGYEISEWALERFEAQRAATERLPTTSAERSSVAAPAPTTPASLLPVLDRMIDEITVDANALENRAAHMLAEALGDTVIIYRRVRENELEVVHVAHHNPQAQVLATTLARDPRTVNSFAYRTFRAGTSVFVPQVPQRELRRCLDPELHEYLDALGCYILISVPIGTEGALLATRDLPGRPYSQQDVVLMESVAARVLFGTARAERGAYARDTRRRVVRALTASTDRDGTPPDAAVLDELLGCALEHDPQAVVAVLDLDLRHLVCTKAYGELLGEDRRSVLCTPLSLYVHERAGLDDLLDPLRCGELDYRGRIVGLAGHRGRIALHVAMLRTPDATPWGFVVVAHAAAEPVLATPGA